MPKDAFRREVALRLKQARRQQALTQRQLADLGDSTQQNISRYEKGFIPDSWFLLARLHAERAIDLNWLLGPPAEGLVEVPSALRDGAPLVAEFQPATTTNGEPSRPVLDSPGMRRIGSVPAGTLEMSVLPGEPLREGQLHQGGG
jgi:transcriptional regulator with XRE-family HTH domain